MSNEKNVVTPAVSSYSVIACSEVEPCEVAAYQGLKIAANSKASALKVIEW